MFSNKGIDFQMHFNENDAELGDNTENELSEEFEDDEVNVEDLKQSF